MTTRKKLTPKQRMLDKLRESGLDSKDVKKLGFVPYTTEVSKALKLSRAGEGFKITYRDMYKKLLPMFRYRYFDTVVSEGFTAGAPLRRYDQPKNTPVEIYLPVYCDWKEIAKDSTKPLILTEGELKSACATKNGLSTIGLGGVDCWGGRKQGQRLHPTLAAFDWSHRDVYIVYDSDAATKPEVMGAENRLAAALLDAGAVVRIPRIPGEGNKKVGLDDFLVKHGVEAFKELQKLTPEWVKSRQLHELNAEYAFSRETACVVEIATRRVYPPETFKNTLEAHRKMKIGDDPNKMRDVSAAKEWIVWPAKTTVDGLTYSPGEPVITPQGKFNLWRGPGIEPREGDTSLFDRLIEHMVTNAADRTWLWRWTAYPLQHPGARNNVAVLLWSLTQGTGKSLLCETIGYLHGSENFIEIGQPELGSSFNEWQPRRTLIIGAELCGESARDVRAFADKLKSMITATDVVVNQKHQSIYRLPNRANYILTSNHPTALHLDHHARRFFVAHTAEAKLPQCFYTDFLKWRDNGGLNALLHKMLRVDLAGFEPGADAPRTQAMGEMVAAGRSDLQAWCHDLREDSIAALLSCNVQPILAETRFATARQLLNWYLVRTPGAHVNQQQMALELATAGLVRANKGTQIRIPSTGARERLWILRDHVRAANLPPDKIGEEWDKAFRHLQQHRVGGQR